MVEAQFGDLVRRNPALFPPPIGEIVSKAWGYSSNFGRHLQEGAPPTFEEAELLGGTQWRDVPVPGAQTPEELNDSCRRQTK
jgi:hypothetical protein